MKKILVIEDEPILRENIFDLLNLNGYLTNQAADAEKGLTKIREWRPDLILCDIKMPGKSGYWVLEQIKDDIQYATVPFIFLTAKVETDDIRTGMKLGADDYLTKPFKVNDLFDSIEARFKRVELFKAGFSVSDSANVASQLNRRIVIDSLESLTKSEKEILHMISQGLSSADIAEKRFNSVKTIENHRANIIAKLGLNGHLALVKFSMSIE
jgi:two-component system, OmpR family, response regulator